jgi:hypothetical protein
VETAEYFDWGDLAALAEDQRQDERSSGVVFAAFWPNQPRCNLGKQVPLGAFARFRTGSSRTSWSDGHEFGSVEHLSLGAGNPGPHQNDVQADQSNHAPKVGGFW